MAIAERIGPHLMALEEATTHIHTMADEAAAHAARIVAKRLRYLIEPAREVEGVSELLKRLRKLQDALGELHDAHVMAHELGDVLKEAAKADARRTTARVLGRALVPDNPGDDAYAQFPREGVVSLMRKLRADITMTFESAEQQFTGAAAEALRQGATQLCWRGCVRLRRRGGRARVTHRIRSSRARKRSPSPLQTIRGSGVSLVLTADTSVRMLLSDPDKRAHSWHHRTPATCSKARSTF